MSTDALSLRSRQWKTDYRTSTSTSAEPVDILHDFYIPALKLASRYDRMAGYFRSSSLAAASQGFSSYIGRGGNVRLIVGADLADEDTAAIMAGDKARLAKRLNDELTPKEPWPQNVENGVTLLAWMVANGYLEVRVAFRVDGATREPRPFDFVGDGYVHEKWLVLHDELGNRLAAAGSLNESKTALSINAENLSVFCDWHAGSDKERVDNYATDFEVLWADKHPHLRVLPLPQAVKDNLIRLGENVSTPREIDGTSAYEKETSAPKEHEPSAMELLRFAVVRDGPKMPNGRYVGLETAPVDPWPHQAVIARRLVDTWPYSYLLCDEVGLGKTIEAGLAFRSLYLSGIVSRILVAAPASLTRQWQRQMADKMLLPFGLAMASPSMQYEYNFPNETTIPAQSLFEANLIVISTGLIGRHDRVRSLGHAQPFDIVLLDEAHAARRRNSTKGSQASPEYGQLYRAMQDYVKPLSASLWLATATPMQLHPVEVSDLIALTDRVGQYQFDPTMTLGYYEILSKLVRDEALSDSEWDFLRRSTASVKSLDPFLWDYIHKYVIDGRSRTAVDQWLEYGMKPRQHHYRHLKRILFAAAPLSRVMLRHTRSLLEIYKEKGQLNQNLATRHILPLPAITFTPLEKKAYDDLEAYANGLTEQVSRSTDGGSRNMMQFLLSFMRLRFASSLFAIKETLRRRLGKVEATLRQEMTERSVTDNGDGEGWIAEYEDEDVPDAVDSVLVGRQRADLEWEKERLQDMLRTLDGSEFQMSSKMQVLLQTLDERKRAQQPGRIKQTVIFTRFYDTLTDIVRRLRQAQPNMHIGTYSGKGGEFYDVHTRRLVSIDREVVKELFLRGDIDVLVCTDAAAEGLNLQTADLLINYDLGWNPMKVEQRIGRIDRIGQLHDDIFVLNLCYANSAEAVVYGRLWERLQKAHTVVGRQQASILPVGLDQFQQLTAGELTADELIQQAEATLVEQQRQTESMELPPEDLYDIYRRMGGDGKSVQAPVDRNAIWQSITESEYLQNIGCEVVSINGTQVFQLMGIDGVRNGTLLTVSPGTYDRGLAKDAGPLRFASYGEPVFDRLLEHMTRFQLPACIRKIKVSVNPLPHIEMIGYGVLLRTADGHREVRLIQSWQELKDFETEGRSLAIDEELTDTDTAPLRQKMLDIAREQLRPHVIADQLEKENVRSAYAQRLLSLHVIEELLRFYGNTVGPGASFQAVLRQAAAVMEDKPLVIVTQLPANVFRHLADQLLFDVRIPSVGKDASLRTPPILRESGMDLARVVEDRAKVGRGSMDLESMLRRLRQEAYELQRKIAG